MKCSCAGVFYFNTCDNDLCRPNWILDFTLLYFFLAVDTVGCPGQRFETLSTDGLATVEALAERALGKPGESIANQAKLLMAARSLAEEKLLLVRKHRLICGVEGVFSDNLAALLDR